MILLDSFNKDEIILSTKKFQRADPSIIELVIYAFYLLEQLSINKLDFIFKGGTSLLFFFDPPFRFSTDIDIVTTESREKIEESLSKICENSSFSGWKLDEKRSYKTGIPKAHYILYFNSKLEERQREILLDILFEENVYPGIDEFDIRLSYILTDGIPVKVNTPVADALLGDKLTAFAPGTVGIQFGKNKGRDIVKQVFDIGCLFNILTNLELVKTAFERIAAKQIAYRVLKIEMVDISDDVLQTSFLFARIFRNLKEKNDAKLFLEIRQALIAFRPFTTVRSVYTIETLLFDASIASYLTALIATKKINKFRKFDKNEDSLKDYYFENELNYLNRLSRFPNGTLYYLKSAYDLLYAGK